MAWPVNDDLLRRPVGTGVTGFISDSACGEILVKVLSLPDLSE